jgi:undecaprenyl pyrophosphate phosphatase UppP
MYKNKNDNTGLNFICIILSSFLCTIFGIWAIIEFVLYLIKDNPFNWISLYLTIVSLIAEVFFFLKTFLNN